MSGLIRLEIRRALPGTRLALVAVLFALIALTLGRTIYRGTAADVPSNHWDVVFDLLYDTRWVGWLFVPVTAAATVDLVLSDLRSGQAVLAAARVGSRRRWMGAKLFALVVAGPGYALAALLGTTVGALFLSPAGWTLSEYGRLAAQTPLSPIAGKPYTLAPALDAPLVSAVLLSGVVGVTAAAFTTLFGLLPGLALRAPWAPPLATVGAVAVLWRTGDSPWNPFAHLLLLYHGPNSAGVHIGWTATAVAVAVQIALSFALGALLVERTDL